MIDALSKDTLIEAVRRATILYRHKLAWQKLVRNGMTREFDWKLSAHQYLEVYRQICPV